MNLRNRIERLENAAGANPENIPEIIIRFIEPVRNDNGTMRPGRCTGGLRMSFGKPQQWLDADMKPVAESA